MTHDAYGKTNIEHIFTAWSFAERGYATVRRPTRPSDRLVHLSDAQVGLYTVTTVHHITVTFTVILVVCRDLRPSPWFCVTAVKIS